jgi:DNA repair exonuclease SbcCD nuclease subunit
MASDSSAAPSQRSTRINRYAPTPVAHFAGRGVAAWVVGHVHLPCEWTDATPVAYTGSPQALDWGEVGSHGYRWLTIEHGKAQFSPVQAISTVRYQVEEIELDLGEDLQGRLAEKAAAYGAAHDGTESIRFRVHVRLKKGATLPAALADEPGMIAANGFAYCVRSVTNVPEVNLHLEAQNSDARGQAARLLLGLDGKGQPEWRTAAQELVRKIESQMQVERTNLRLLDDEALDFLRTAAPDEAQFAVKKVLEDVLALQEAR